MCIKNDGSIILSTYSNYDQHIHSFDVSNRTSAESLFNGDDDPSMLQAPDKESSAVLQKELHRTQPPLVCVSAIIGRVRPTVAKVEKIHKTGSNASIISFFFFLLFFFCKAWIYSEYMICTSTHWASVFQPIKDAQCWYIVLLYVWLVKY